MRTQFQNTADMFKRMPAVAVRARAFAGRAARIPAEHDRSQPLAFFGRVFVAPAENAGEWDYYLRNLPCSYLMATDGHRLHAAVVATTSVPDDAIPYDSDLHFEEVIESTLPGNDARVVALDARYLREAIATGASFVILTVPKNAGEAVVVASLSEDYGQLAWATVMPLTRMAFLGGGAPKLAIPKPEGAAAPEPEQS